MNDGIRGSRGIVGLPYGRPYGKPFNYQQFSHSSGLNREKAHGFTYTSDGLFQFFLLFFRKRDGLFLVGVADADLFHIREGKAVEDIDRNDTGMLVQPHIGGGVESAAVGEVIEAYHCRIGERDQHVLALVDGLVLVLRNSDGKEKGVDTILIAFRVAEQ